jgi:hypothetical protein
MGNYFLNILIAFDRMVNTFIGGDPDETLSSVAYRKHRDGMRFGFMMSIINTLFFNPNHCEHAYGFDRDRKLKP